MARELPFEVTDSLYFTVVIYLLFFSSLAYLSSGFSKSADPVYLYMFWTLFLIVLGIGGANWERKGQVLGLDEPYSGFNIFMLMLGAGIGGLLYAFLSHQSASIFAGTRFYSVVAKPLYAPLSLPEYSINLGLGGSGQLIYYSWVALTEEFAILLMWKNLTNWFVKKGLKIVYAATISFLIGTSLWGSWHLFAWPALTLPSILMAILFHTFFWSSYFVVDISGIISSKDPIKWSGFLVAGGLSSHFLWDVYITAGIPGFLTFNQFVLGNFGLIGISMALMWLVKRNFEKATPATVIERRNKT